MSKELEDTPLDQRPARGPRPSEAPTSARGWIWLVGAGIVVFVLVVGFAGANSYQDLSAARARIDELDEQIGRAKQRASSLGDEIWLLQNDPATLERVAREELGVVAPGEIVVVLPESK